ncbi:MAG: hypothetical protein KDD78_12365 [Caldilineaceae bacterium]|nr:hypothetical protein [Caldilineaceae bacterium]
MGNREGRQFTARSKQGILHIKFDPNKKQPRAQLNATPAALNHHIGQQLLAQRLRRFSSANKTEVQNQSTGQQRNQLPSTTKKQ